MTHHKTTTYLPNYVERVHILTHSPPFSSLSHTLHTKKNSSAAGLQVQDIVSFDKESSAHMGNYKRTKIFSYDLILRHFNTGFFFRFYLTGERVLDILLQQHKSLSVPRKTFIWALLPKSKRKKFPI